MMDLRKVAAAYGGKLSSANQCNIPTPGHSVADLGTSITLKSGAPDGVLVKCHNGSDSDAIAVKDMLRRDGFLPPREARNDNAIWPKGHSLPASDHAVRLSSGQRIVATFEYRGEQGELLYRKHRIEPGPDGRPKEFRYDRPDGRGGWVSGQGSVAVPYRLADLIAVPETRPVYMAEGEAKADKLAEWGLSATSHKDWKEIEFGRYVRGRKVYILPDNDDAGRTQAAKAKDAIDLAGGMARIVELPGLPVKGDILDWSGTVEDLQRFSGACDDDVLTPLDLAALAKVRATPIEFAIERIAPLGEVTLLIGPGSAGKSLLAQQLATAAVAQILCLGLRLVDTQAIYLTCEDDIQQLHWRQQHICESLNIDMAGLAGRLHLISLRGELGNELGTFGTDGTLKPSKAFYRLVQTIQLTGSKLVFLDNVAHLFAGNENDRGQVTQFVNLLNRASRETGASIVLIGHPNKAGDEWSGSTAWSNAVRSRLYLEYDPIAGLRKLTLPKANYSENGDIVTFRWHNWSFARDEDLSDDTAAQLRALSASNFENNAFLDCLRERARQGIERGVGPSPGPNYAPSQFAGMPQAKGLKKEALKRAMDRLYQIGKIDTAMVDRPGKSDKKTIIVEVPEPFPNALPNGARTAFPNAPERPTEPSRTHTVYKYISGAASATAAPEYESDDEEGAE